MHSNKRYFNLNKLVRDKIPEIMKSSDIDVEIKTLNYTEYISSLKNKLIEETKEVFDAKSREEIIEELADVLEVITTLKNALNIFINEVEEKRLQKNTEKGRFLQKIFINRISMDKSNKNISYYKSRFHPTLQDVY